MICGDPSVLTGSTGCAVSTSTAGRSTMKVVCATGLTLRVTLTSVPTSGFGTTRICGSRRRWPWHGTWIDPTSRCHCASLCESSTVTHLTFGSKFSDPPGSRRCRLRYVDRKRRGSSGGAHNVGPQDQLYRKTQWLGRHVVSSAWELACRIPSGDQLERRRRQQRLPWEADRHGSRRHNLDRGRDYQEEAGL